MQKWVIYCDLTLEFKSAQDASIFYSSYLPEHGTMPKKRSKVTLAQNEAKIIFSVKAMDITAFRATINSLLQFSNVVFRIVEKVDSLK
ncbi:MAG: hypothetical protein JW776_01935 [Candidatus Lokiarchaeota archaeon]|nr:hypothetical protein [Candidatus Lokiarchaeota archaeon]